MDLVNIVNIYIGYIFCGCSLKAREGNGLLT